MPQPFWSDAFDLSAVIPLLAEIDVGLLTEDDLPIQLDQYANIIWTEGDGLMAKNQQLLQRIILQRQMISLSVSISWWDTCNEEITIAALFSKTPPIEFNTPSVTMGWGF